MAITAYFKSRKQLENTKANLERITSVVWVSDRSAIKTLIEFDPESDKEPEYIHRFDTSHVLPEEKYLTSFEIMKVMIYFLKTITGHEFVLIPDKQPAYILFRRKDYHQKVLEYEKAHKSRRRKDD